MIVGQNVYRKEGRKKIRKEGRKEDQRLTFNTEYKTQRNQLLSFENTAQRDANWNNVEHGVLSPYMPQKFLPAPQTSPTTEKALLI